MKIAILGYDREGEASYQYFSALNDKNHNRSYEITICDQKTDIVVPEGVTSRLGEQYLDDLGEFDVLVRTAGMPPQVILDKNPDVADKITSGTNEFLLHAPTTNIIGITGTKGKGTTSTMVAKMLEAAGRTVHLGGNIGVPALSLLPNISPDDWVVLEMSSFQLADLKTSPHIATCLMVMPEHQDWHGSLEEYYTAKEQLFARQVTGDIAIYFEDNAVSKHIASAGQGQKIPYYHTPGAEVVDGNIVIGGATICRTDELKLLGQHNWQNACAAVTTVWYALQTQAGKSDPAKLIDAMRSVLTSFTGLPFRIEFRADKHGIRYYNDSFASAPPAPLAAIAAIAEPKVVILGGFDRQLDLDELAKGLKNQSNSIRHALLIGAAAERLAAACKQHGFDNFTISTAHSMTDIVTQATQLAQPGDVVLLSPGFASFDMFKNFEDRGQQFNAAVEAL